MPAPSRGATGGQRGAAQGRRRTGGRARRRVSASPSTRRAIARTVQQVRQRPCPCWNRLSGPPILAAAEPPPLTRRNRRSEATTRRPPPAPALYRKPGGVPTPPNLRPDSHAGTALGKGLPARDARTRPCRCGFGVAGSGRFAWAWGAPPAIGSGQGRRCAVPPDWRCRCPAAGRTMTGYPLQRCCVVPALE